MRKLCLFILLFSSFGSLFAEDFSAAIQEKLLLPFLEVRSSQNLMESEKWNWGTVLYTSRFWKHFPCQIKVGNLTGTGGLSKLKEPSLSTSITPFSKARTDVSEITAALPGLSSSKKDVSIFGEFCYANKKKIFSSSKLNFFYNNEDIFPVFSGSQTITLFKKINFAFAATGGYFTYPENTFNSWFTTSDFYYHQGKHFCFNPQLSVKLPHFESLFSAPTYQTPFGKLQSAYKTENKISFGHSMINLSLFYNEHKNLLTTRENTLKDMIQTKIGFQTTLPAGRRRPVFLRSGFTAMNTFYLSEENFDSHKMKVSLGSRLFSMLYSFSFIINSNFTIDTSSKKASSDFESASLQLANSWYFRKITPEFTMNFSVKPDKDYSGCTTSEKIGINLAFMKNPKITASSALNFTQKDGTSTKQDFTCSVCAHWKTKFLALTGKIGFKTEN